MLARLVRLFFLSMPFIPLWGFILRGILGLNVAVMTIYGIFSVLLFFILLLTKKIRNISFPKYLIPVIILAIYYFIWNFFNGNIEENGILTALVRDYHIFTVTTIVLIVNTSFPDKFITKMIFLLKLTVVPAIIVSVIQATVAPLFLTPLSYLIENRAYLGNIYEMRPPSIFGYLDANDCGLTFPPILSIILAYYLITKKDKVKTIFIMFLGGLVCLLSNSRYNMLNFLIVLTESIKLKSFNMRKALAYTVLIGAGIGFSAILLTNYVGYDLDVFIKERIMSESATSRLLAFELLYKFFPQNPIFGTGLRVTQDLAAEIKGITSQIHVGYLSVIFEYGFLGAGLTFLFWYKVAINFYKNAQETRFWGSFFGFLTFLAANMVLVQYYIYFYGIMLLFIFDSYFKEKLQLEAKVSIDIMPDPILGTGGTI